MYRPFALHGVNQPDRSFLIGYFDPFRIVADAIIAAAGADAPHVNTGLSAGDWDRLLGSNSAEQIQMMAARMGNVLADRDQKVTNAEVKNYEELKKTANGLWNMMATIGEVVPLHKDGTDAVRVPFPQANKNGGFEWVSTARAWVDPKGPRQAAPTSAGIYSPAKISADWVYAPTTTDQAGVEKAAPELLDRDNSLATLAMYVGRLELAYHLGAHGKLEALNGPAIFGPADERNKQQQAVQLQRVINYRMLGLAYRLQPVLMMAHSIREWLFGGAGSAHPVEEELARTYSKADIDFVREQLTRICDLPMSRAFAFAMERVGWREMPTAWGPKPTLDLPIQLAALVDGGSKAEGRLPSQGVLGRSGALCTFVDELHTLVTSSYVTDGYRLAATIMNAEKPGGSKRFLPPPLEPMLAYTDGVNSSEPLDAHSLWALPLFRADSHVGGLGQPPSLHPVKEGDDLRIVAAAVAQTGSGWIHESGTPLIWRPGTEYQGDVDAIWIHDVTAAALAALMGTSEAALIESVQREPSTWAHLLKRNPSTNEVSVVSPAIFRSGRTELVHHIAIKPEAVGPDTYFRWKDGRPLATLKGVDARASLQKRSWSAVLTAEMPTLGASATGAVTDLLKRLSVPNVARTAFTSVS